MKPLTFMLLAGEASGDLLAAELVRALRVKVAEWQALPTDNVQPLRTNLEPQFFGAGRQQMAAAGVEIAVDMTPFAVVGFSDPVKQFLPLRRAFHRLLRLAIERQPDVVVGVDYGGFNLRFASAIKRHVRARIGSFNNWNPRLVQYVSPQVWASREGRADRMERDLDLLLSIFPFEKDWYARRVPRLPVEFVGHPILDRYPQNRESRGESRGPTAAPMCPALDPRPSTLDPPQILLLPGSRPAELRCHLPVMLGALELIRAKLPQTGAEMVLPNAALLAQVGALGLPRELRVQAGGLAEALRRSTIALAKTGTVTVECAFFGVPAVTLYRTSWSTYQVAKRKARVRWLTMPNLLAGEAVFPEFIQHAATPENIARAALELLTDATGRREIKAKLAKVVASLGGPGASHRAADAIVKLLAGRRASPIGASAACRRDLQQQRCRPVTPPACPAIATARRES